MKKLLFLAVSLLAACSTPSGTPVTQVTPPVVTPPVVVPFGKTQTERLRGAWSHTFTIASTTFTDKHELTSALTESTSTPGDYLIFGKNQYAAATGGGYNTKLKDFLVLTLNPNSVATFDDVYEFTLDSNSQSATGCYYLYYHNGNLSRCYALTGRKIASLNGSSLQNQSLKTRNVELQSNPGLQREFNKFRVGLKTF
jgi:hypothetical protein